MKSVRVQGKDLVQLVGAKSASELGLDSHAEFELVEISSSAWVLVHASPNALPSLPANASMPLVIVPASSALDERIYSLLKSKPLNERMERKFERLLSREELARFNELVHEKKIRKFKTSPKFHLAIYEAVSLPGMNPVQTSASIPGPDARFLVEKKLDEYSLEEDGFVITKDEAKARELSQRLEDRIKARQVRGMKAFDGFFYIVDTSLLARFDKAIQSFLRARKTAELNDIALHVKVSKPLARTVCEFMREDGNIIEKRRDLFQYVE